MKSRKTMYELVLNEACRRPPIKLRDGRIGYGMYRADVKKLFVKEGFKPRRMDVWLAEWGGSEMIISGETSAGSIAYLIKNLVSESAESLKEDIEKYGFQESKEDPETLDAKKYNTVVV